MRYVRRITLLQVFSLISLIGVVAIGVGLGVVIGTAIEESSLAGARDQLADVIRTRASAAAPDGTPALLDLPPGQFAQLHNTGADYQQWHDRVVRMFDGLPIYLVKIWNNDSTIVWSDRPVRIGEQHPEDDELQSALNGQVHAAISSLSKAENVPERQDEPALLEVYVPVLARGSFQVLGAFEVYEQVEDLAAQIDAARSTAWVAIIASMALLYLVLVGLVARASRTITRLQRLQELERYFSPAVARAIALGDNLNQRLLTRGEISILFTDIRGFTRQSEQMDAEDVVQMLNAYMDVVTTAVFGTNGSIDKFLGDGVLAVFGAPLPDPTHAVDALRAALQIRAGLDALNAARQTAGQPSIIVGTAVTTGLTVTGNIGSAKQLSFTVTGDTVNLGARLVGIAGPGQILISARTVELMREDGPGAGAPGVDHLRGPFTVQIRGRDEPASIYVLEPDTDASPGSTPAEAILAVGAPAL